jgi:hypothetical protein
MDRTIDFDIGFGGNPNVTYQVSIGTSGRLSLARVEACRACHATSSARPYLRCLPAGRQR